MLINSFERFFGERQAYSQYRLPLDIVKAEPLADGGIENRCYENAHQNARLHEWSMVSGWLYTRTNPVDGVVLCQFTQHWWNWDPASGLYFDGSPAVDESAVYISDMNLAKFVLAHQNVLTSHVASSVLVDGSIYLLDYATEDDGVTTISKRPAKNLSERALFGRYLPPIPDT